MKNTVLLLLLGGLFFSSSTTYAQIPDVPADYAFRSSRDYLEQQDLAISCIVWLQENHPEDFEPRRREMNRFVDHWVTGNPSLHLKFDEAVYNSILKEKGYAFIEELGRVYLYSKALYVLGHPGSKDDIKAKLAATDKMLELYGIIVANDPTAESKTMEKFLKLREKDKLKDHIAKVTG